MLKLAKKLMEIGHVIFFEILGSNLFLYICYNFHGIGDKNT